MIRAIIFDCFGVLIADSLQVMIDGVAQRSPNTAQEIAGIVRAANKGVLEPIKAREMMAVQLGLSLEEYQKRLHAGETKNRVLLDHILTLRPHYKTAILSNVGADSLEKRFAPGELAEHFDVTVASGDIGFAKPEPEAYLITAERLGVLPEECVFTDDRIGFCDAATSVNMQSILYTDFAQFAKELGDLLARENS